MRNTCFYIFLYIFVINLFASTGLIGHVSHLLVDESLIPTCNELLIPPKMLSEEERIEGVKNRDLDMTWYIGKDDYFRFKTKHDEIYFEVVFAQTFPECFEEIDKQAFLHNSPLNQQRQQEFIYAYRWHEVKDKPIINFPIEEKAIQADSKTYLVSDRRVFEKSNPLSLSEEELVSILSNHRVVFYTGAGISAASNVPTMTQLFQLLKLEEGIGFLSSLKATIRHPHELASNIKSFHRACFFNSPTKAHFEKNTNYHRKFRLSS